MTHSRLFSDSEVIEATGLGLDNLRKLITWGAVRPEQSGGGRGRVRMWTLRQSMRIAATAAVYRAGFSLRMAHTLVYALPLDDMLLSYDPELWGQGTGAHQFEPWNASGGAVVLDRLLSTGEYRIGRDRRRIGHIHIVQGSLVYTDALGRGAALFGYIDRDRNIFVSFRDPAEFSWGAVYNSFPHLPRRVGMSEIDPASLSLEILLPDRPAGAEDDPWAATPNPDFRTRIDPAVLPYWNDHPTIKHDDAWFSIRTEIALHMEMDRAFRQLHGLPFTFARMLAEGEAG